MDKNTPIEELNLTVMTFIKLKNRGYNTLRDLKKEKRTVLKELVGSYLYKELKEILDNS